MKEIKQAFLKLIRKLSKKTNEDGFTLIETVLTVFLFGVLAVTVAGSVIIGQKVVTQVISSSHTNLKLVQMDNYIRGLLARIECPYWLASLKYEYKASSLEIPYLDGKPDKYFVIKSEEQGFSIGYRDESEEPEEPEESEKSEDSTETVAAGELKKSGEAEIKEEFIYFGPYYKNELEIEEEDEHLQSVHLAIRQTPDSQDIVIDAILSTNAFWVKGP